MATATSFAQLSTGQTQQQIYQVLLSVYQAFGFSVQSWQEGGVERTRLMAISAAIADIYTNYIVQAANGGFVDTSTGAWLQTLALELYNLPFNPAGFTVGNITLTSVGTAPTYTISAGQLKAAFALSGNTYVNTTGGVLSSGGSLTLQFTASAAGAAFNDPSNSGNLTLVNPLPGVSLANPAGPYSVVGHVGAGTGTLFLGGSPSANHSVTLRIDATNTSAPTLVSYSLDGAPYISLGSISSVTNLGGTGINITLTNGVSGTSWVLNDTYSFNTPGSWITTQGNDVESDASLRNRSKSRWSTLSPIPVTNFYTLLATSTPGVGSQVTQVIALPDSVIPSQINMIVAGPGGILPPATVSAIQTYVTPRVPGTERCLVQSPSTLSITLAGTITCQASLLTAVQGAVQTAMTNYILSVGINGTIRVSAIIDAIMNINQQANMAGSVVDVTGVTINGSGSNLTLGSSVSFVLPQLVTPLSFGYATQ